MPRIADTKTRKQINALLEAVGMVAARAQGSAAPTSPNGMHQLVAPRVAEIGLQVRTYEGPANATPEALLFDIADGAAFDRFLHRAGAQPSARLRKALSELFNNFYLGLATASRHQAKEVSLAAGTMCKLQLIDSDRYNELSELAKYVKLGMGEQYLKAKQFGLLAPPDNSNLGPLHQRNGISATEVADQWHEVRDLLQSTAMQCNGQGLLRILIRTTEQHVAKARETWAREALSEYDGRTVVEYALRSTELNLSILKQPHLAASIPLI